MKRILTTAVTLAAAAVMCAPTASADPSQDREYLRRVQAISSDIEITDTAEAVMFADTVCKKIYKGYTEQQVAREAWASTTSNITLDVAMQVVRIAVDVYCPTFHRQGGAWA